ncbi:efflux RND transporter permease subunit [candidate division KSB1 bacterium]|nr:efflux RND transporter permease subunit [candidate division KSB1 bacterium]
MNIARGPIHRPILTSIIYFIIILLGLVSFSRLSIDLMPEVTFPSISVVTSYGNVGPQEMEELVTRPIEEALAAVQGVEEITSTSSEGRSVVRVAFAWGTDLDVASNDIRDRVDRVIPRLPEDIERPMIRKFDLSAFPIANIGVSSNMNPVVLRQLLEDQVKYRLERVPGVAAVDIWGGLYREIHVDLLSDKIKALGLSSDAIIAALRNENRNIPAGLYDKGNFEILVRTQGEFNSLEQIRQTVVTVRDGTPILIRDIADVVDSWEEVRTTIRINGRPGVRLSINKQSGANTVTVADAVKEEIASINRDIPQIELIPLMDTSKYIKRSINNVANSTMIGGLLAIVILFLFLRNVSSTLIIATAIPISIIATFGLMYFGGLTLNMITFGGLALGVGMLVDSSIVVLENIYRHRERGDTLINASLTGTQEVWSPIVASVLTTVVVFLPVVFMRGMSGLLYQQMAYVVSFSLLCSLLVSLTLIPMLSSRFLHFQPATTYEGDKPLHRIYAKSEAIFRRVEDKYRDILDWALNHRRSVVFLTLGLFILSVILVRFIGVELMPAADEGEVRVNMELAVGTRLEIVDEVAKTVEDIVRKEVPEMESIVTRAGGGGWSSGHTADIRINLVPLNRRKRSSEQIANDLRVKLANIPGTEIRTRAGQGLFILRMGSSSSENVSIEVRGYDLTTAQHLAARVEAAVKKVDGITDTYLSREEGSPEQLIYINRSKAADLGLTVTRIGEALQTAIGGTTASYFREHGKEYRILVRLSEADRKNLADLLDLTVVNNRGESIILRNVLDVQPKEGPVRIERKDQERIITINANYTGRDMGSIINDIRKELRSVPIPRDFAVIFGGDYEEQQKSFRELMIGFILALLLVYMVMAGQFESFIDPFIVLFSIPMGLIGIVITLVLTGTIFSMQAFIGCIILVGIVVNNAIILVDYTNQLRRHENMSLMEAITTAGVRRLRPILMTTITTVLGLIPLSLGLGEGGEAQAPMARVVIGGLTSSTLITLVLIPVVYSLFEQKFDFKKLTSFFRNLSAKKNSSKTISHAEESIVD